LPITPNANVKYRSITSFICCFFLQHNIELFDPRGRTPLHLAVALGHLESTNVLLKHGADATTENRAYWSGKHLSSIFPIPLEI